MIRQELLASILGSFQQRRGLFTDERGSKKREGSERWYMFNKKI